MKYDDPNKLHTLLYDAIVAMKQLNPDVARKLATLDQQLKNNESIHIVSSKITVVLSNYLMTHKYKAPKSVIELQQYVEKIAQVYNGKFSPIMWFQ